MKKPLVACLLSAGLLGAMAVPAMAVDPGPDVTICHLPAAMDHPVIYWGGYKFTYSFGVKETVGARAKAPHLAHGDFSYFYTLDPETKSFFEQYRGVVFEDWVDCYFYDLEELP